MNSKTAAENTSVPRTNTGKPPIRSILATPGSEISLRGFDGKGFDRRIHGVNADALKALAMAIMLIDHIGAFLVDNGDPIYYPLRTAGRLAFPIFCFLIAEGAYYTRSVPKYLGRLALFAVISTPPYNLVHGSKWYSPGNVNVYFTLFLGLAALYSVTDLPREIFIKADRFRLAENRTACALAGLPLCALCYMAAYLMGTDYGEYGVAAILVFGLLRKRPAAAWAGFAALTFVFYGFFIVLTGPAGNPEYCRVNLINVLNRLLFVPGARLYYYPRTQLYAALACIPCLLYNGKKSEASKKHPLPLKYAFYVFYPVHLWCLRLIQLLMK